MQESMQEASCAFCNRLIPDEGEVLRRVGLLGERVASRHRAQRKQKPNEPRQAMGMAGGEERRTGLANMDFTSKPGGKISHPRNIQEEAPVVIERALAVEV